MNVIKCQAFEGLKRLIFNPSFRISGLNPNYNAFNTNIHSTAIPKSRFRWTYESSHCACADTVDTDFGQKDGGQALDLGKLCNAFNVQW